MSSTMKANTIMHYMFDDVQYLSCIVITFISDPNGVCIPGTVSPIYCSTIGQFVISRSNISTLTLNETTPGLASVAFVITELRTI